MRYRRFRIVLDLTLDEPTTLADVGAYVSRTYPGYPVGRADHTVLPLDREDDGMPVAPFGPRPRGQA